MPAPPFPTSPSPAWYRQAQWNGINSKRNAVHYVGDDVVIDLAWATPNYNTFIRQADFERGTNGNTITTGPSEQSYSGWELVNGTPTYDSTRAAHGNLSARFSGSEFLEWDLGSHLPTDYYLRWYFYATANPAGGSNIFQDNPDGGGNTINLQVTAAGLLAITCGGAFTSAASIALNQWIRIEMHILHSATVGQITGRLFNSPDSAIPTEEWATTANLNSGTGPNNLSFGRIAGSWGADISFDEIIGVAPDWIGPYSATPPAIVNPVTYTVRDFYGDTVVTGTFEEGHETFTLDEPVGGWQPGWYRLYLTGSQTNADFANSYGGTNFCVVRSDSHFVSMPAGNTSGGNISGNDYVLKGVMGLGTSRISVDDAANPNIPNLQTDVALTQTYWTDTGTPDPARPAREPWVAFGGATSSAPQQAGVTSVVAALYPDVKYFEGPSNEPAMNAATAADMQTFADAVHAGHPDAQAIGPAFVDILNLAGWDDFLNAGGGDACDGISFHAYNSTTNGDLNLANYTIQAWLELIDSYGLGGKVLWQTESTQATIIPYGIYHPRRARKMLLDLLIYERFGIPRERNNPWYDVSNGFWDFPAWLSNIDGSVEAQTVLGRVLAEETWGRSYSHALDFGTPGNNIFLGNVYSGDTGTTVALFATSFIEGASITLSLVGAGSSVALVDGFGRESTLDVQNGRVTVDMTEIPMYVQLPVGASASVYSMMDWPPTGIGVSSGPLATTREIDGVSYPEIADNAFETNYGAGTGLVPPTWATPPSEVKILWDDPQVVRRLIIWTGQSWQNAGSLITFDVDTTDDGLVWTTRTTVARPALSYFEFGTDFTNVGCFLETFWDEQWVYDVLLPEEVICSGVRLNVSASSYGGEPLSALSTDFGQGNPDQAFRIQEIGVYSVGEAQHMRRGGGAPPKGVAKRKAGDGEAVYQSYIILSG